MFLRRRRPTPTPTPPPDPDPVEPSEPDPVEDPDPMRAPDPEPPPGHGSHISVGRDNTAPIQNVSGRNISRVSQKASMRQTSTPVTVDTVRDLLAAFRAEIDRNESHLGNAQILRAMADHVDSTLAAPGTPGPADPAETNTLLGIAQALPALVMGTVVRDGGEALAHAITSLLT
jgi:hypothetical protein